jgi:hypothetical protein
VRHRRSERPGRNSAPSAGEPHSVCAARTSSDG